MPKPTMPKPTTPKRASRATFSNELRDLIADDGRTHYSLGKAAGIAPGVISRFVAGERAVTSTTIDALAGALGVHLVGLNAPKGRSRKATAKSKPSTPSTEG